MFGHLGGERVIVIRRRVCVEECAGRRIDSKIFNIIYERNIQPKTELLPYVSQSSVACSRFD